MIELAPRLATNSFLAMNPPSATLATSCRRPQECRTSNYASTGSFCFKPDHFNSSCGIFFCQCHCAGKLLTNSFSGHERGNGAREQAMYTNPAGKGSEDSRNAGQRVIPVPAVQLGISEEGKTSRGFAASPFLRRILPIRHRVKLLIAVNSPFSFNNVLREGNLKNQMI